MARIELPDGRWLDLRLPTTDEYLLVLDVPEDEQDKPGSFVKRIRQMRDVINGACIATSWGGKPSDLRPIELVGLIPAWMNATEDDALPPASGTSSETTSPEPGSPTTGEE